jgi:hypothetical protein
MINLAMEVTPNVMPAKIGISTITQMEIPSETKVEAKPETKVIKVVAHLARTIE